MYHSNGNYEAFVHPRKPEGVESKSAYIVGTGLAGLSAAVFLVRDAQMPGENWRPLPSRAARWTALISKDTATAAAAAASWRLTWSACGICSAPSRLWRIPA